MLPATVGLALQGRVQCPQVLPPAEAHHLSGVRLVVSLVPGGVDVFVALQGMLGRVLVLRAALQHSSWGTAYSDGRFMP